VSAEANKIIITDHAYTKKITKWIPMKDQDLLEAITLFAGDTFAKEPFVPGGAIRAIVKELAHSNLIDATAAGSTPVAGYYDNRYVNELKRSGFFTQKVRHSRDERPDLNECLTSMAPRRRAQ